MLNQIIYTAIALGLPFLTPGILTGAIWANEAWGTCCSWVPKEIWSLIAWFLYAACLYARYLPRWGVKRRAWLVVMGFAAAFFTDWEVNFLLPSIHGVYSN